MIVNTWTDHITGEIRVIGIATGSDNQILASTDDIQVLEIVFQNDITTVAQLFENGKPMTGAWDVVAGTFWSEPSFYPLNPTRITLGISNTANIEFELRYRPINATRPVAVGSTEFAQ